MMADLRSHLKSNRSNPVTVMVLVTYCFGSWLYRDFKVPVLRKLLWLLYRAMDLVFVRILGHGEVSPYCKIGRNLHLPHGINGVFINAKAVIGSRVTIFHQVTLGDRNQLGSPTIGDGAFIGAGAKILGPVRIGDNAQIGANAVVVKDVPAGATAVGIPAQIISGSRIRSASG